MTHRLTSVGTAVVAALVVLALLPSPTVAGEIPEPSSPRAVPLAGRVVVLDPGHQLGNRDFPRRINRPVPAGGFRKPCNTTGTSTERGYPEATFVWGVSRIVQRRLERLGAKVVLTRQVNSLDRWGPCVDERGRAGNRIGADLKLSVHADGSRARGARGFHVIAPADRRPWTHDIFRPSRRLALDLRAALGAGGFLRANYVAGGDGLDVRADLATLNLSDLPTAMVELGNMRNPRDARRMSSPAGRKAYAVALVAAVRANLT
ncbi:MAG: N-acetylmuramoyl-L-alanine amidase [Actinomycetota bacterium]|nr:N-acetylmuramoyl-L-alanine amidase [Actinomycetota bacterium]